MGTSTHNNGQKGKTPLIPSWLNNETGENTENVDNTEILNTQVGEPNRFTAPRVEFTRYINSNGRNGRQFKKSISRYIRYSMDGSTNATKRLGSGRNSAARLLTIANLFSTGGSGAVEKYIAVKDLSDDTAMNAFIKIADFVCPDGGTIDEGIVRAAYISAIEESPEIANIKFKDLSIEQIFLILERSMANVILGRITNDIANKVILLPKEIKTAENIISQMKDFIGGAISDAVADLKIDKANISKKKSLKIVDAVYKKAFDIMIEIGEKE